LFLLEYVLPLFTSAAFSLANANCSSLSIVLQLP